MEFKVGDTALTRQTLTKEIIEGYGQLSGDMNPIHFSDEQAANYGFKGSIAHGLFCLGMVSNLIGNELPGPGSIFLDEKLRYMFPVYIGDEIETIVKIGAIRENGIIDVFFYCRNQDGVEILNGVTKVLYKEVNS